MWYYLVVVVMMMMGVMGAHAQAFLQAPDTTTTTTTTTMEEAAGAGQQEAETTVLDLLASIPELSSVLESLIEREFDDVLGDPELTVTVFVPTNEAVAEARQLLPNPDPDRPLPGWLLAYHVIPEVALSKSDLLLMGGEQIMPLNEFDDDGLGILVAGDNVVITGEGSLAVLRGEGVTVGSSIVYVIDSVLVPFDPNEEEDEEEERREEEEERQLYTQLYEYIEIGHFLPRLPEDSIIGVALRDDRLHERFVFGIFANDMVELFEDPDAAMTIFAPTDVAFRETEERLEVDDPFGPPPGWLLNYHVIPGTLVAEDLEDGMVLESMARVWRNGRFIDEFHTVTVGVLDDGTVTLIAEGSVGAVIEANIEAGNSVIHLVDGVLLPFNPDEDD